MSMRPTATPQGEPECGLASEDSDFKMPCCYPCASDTTAGVMIENKEVEPVGESRVRARGGRRGAHAVRARAGKNSAKPCCGTAPACCRWCPDTVCEELEKEARGLPELWWGLCLNYTPDRRTGFERLGGKKEP